MIVEVLLTLKLCFRRKAAGSLVLPALLRRDHEKPDEVRRPTGKDAHYAGGRLLCSAETDAFSASFFPRLQVAAHEVDPDSLMLWKGGLRLVGGKGVECLAKISADSRHVDIWMRHHAERGALPPLLERMQELARQVLAISCPEIAYDVLILSKMQLSERIEAWPLVYRKCDVERALADETSPTAIHPTKTNILEDPQTSWAIPSLKMKISLTLPNPHLALPSSRPHRSTSPKMRPPSWAVVPLARSTAEGGMRCP